jgi:hypothetical protein
MKGSLVLVLAGGIVAAFVQPFTPTGWWLNSGRGVAITSIALGLTAVLVGFRARSLPFRNPIVAAALAFWFGANIGMAVVLFRSGPGTLFPIVIAIGAGISAVAVGAGSIIGTALSIGLRRRPDSPALVSECQTRLSMLRLHSFDRHHPPCTVHLHPSFMSSPPSRRRPSTRATVRRMPGWWHTAAGYAARIQRHRG